METQQLREGIDALFPDGEHLPPAAQLRRAIALWLAGNPYPEIGQYAALLTQGLGNYLRREQRLRELWLDQQSSHGFTTPRDLLKHPDSRGVFILQEHSKVLRSSSVHLNVPLLCNPPPVQRVPELPPCHPTFSTIEALRTAIQEAFNSRTKADGSFENPGGVLSHFIGDWLSTCPCEDTLPDRPFAALLSDVEAWLRSGGCPGSELWTSQGHSFPPLRDFLTAPERSGCFRVVVREGHIGNDLVQLDVEAVRARAEAVAAAAQAPVPAAPTPAGANGSSSGNATIVGAAGASTSTNGAGGSASSSRDAVPSGPAAASAAASSWGSSSARPSPARQLVESAFPVLAAADGDSWHVAADRLRRAIALDLAEGLAPQLGPHCAPQLWLRDFIKKRDVQPLWQAVSGRCKDVCELLVAPESRGVFRLQGLPLYPSGVVFLDMEALARRAAAPPQPQPGPASQQPAAPQQPPAPQPAPHGQTHQHTPSQQRQLQQLELLAAVGNSSAAMVTAPSSSAAPAGKHRPAEIGLAAAAAWPGDSPQCVLRRYAAAELAAAGPCAEAGGWEYAMAVVNVARLLQSTQHAAVMQLQSNMGGRLHWPVLLTSNGGADLMPLREAEQAITPLEAVAATGDCYSHHLLRLVYGDGDAAVLLNVPELMRRHGGSAGEGAGAGGSGSGRLLVAGRAARGAGETDVSWHPQQPGSTHIAAAPTIVVPGRAGRLPDVRMTEAAGSGGGGGGAGGSTAGGGADRSRREAAAPGGHSGDGAHARHWWQQPNGAAGATDTARRPPLEAEVKFDARVESALGLTFRAAAGAEPDAEVLRCVARLLLQAPPPHTLTFPYLGLKVAQQLGRPCPGLRHMCSQRPDVFALELEGTIAIRVQLVCDRLLRLAPSPRQQQSPSRRPALQHSQQAGAGSGAHTSRITGAAPPKQDGAGTVANAVPDPDAGPSAPAAAPAPAQPRNRTAAAPRAAAGPAQRPAAARTLDHASAAELICLAFPLRDDGGGGRWTVLTADQAALQLRQTVAFWLLSNPELSELGPRRATVSALSKHLTKRHKGVWRNPAYGFPSLHDFLQSPDSHGVFALYAHGSPGEPVVELDAVALRRAVVAGSGQHPENGLAAGAEGTAGARAQERGRQRGSTQAAAAEGAAAAGNGAAGTAHNSGSDCGTGKRSSIGKRRSSSPTGAAGISTAAGALNAPLVGAGAGAGAAAGARAGADGRAAGAAAASAPLEESTAALVRAAFPLQLVGNTPASDQPARQLRQAIATWLAGNPYASELGPRRASLRSLGIYLREVCTDLWRNRAHRFPKIVEFLRSPHSRGVFLLFEKGRDTPHLHVELDIVALLHAAAAEAAEMGLVEGADSQNGGDGATAVTVGAGREPAAGAAATAAEAPAPAGAPAATPVGNELEAPAARAVPVRPLQLLQHLQQPHASLPVVAGSVPPEPAQLGPSPVGPALAGAAEPAAMNGAAASGDPSLPRLLVPVPVSQPEPDCGATPLAPPATAQPQPQSLSSVPAPATWVPVSVHAGAGFSARSAGTDGMSEEAAPAVAVDQVGVAAPDAALGSVYQAGPEALEPAAARGYVQPQQAALDEPAQQPLPEAGVCVVNDPYGEELIAMLQHCGCCTRIGLAVQVHGGRPALVSVYAPLALMKVNGADGLLVRWPAAVYLVDPLAAAASYGGGAEGEVAAAALLCSLQPLLEASSISKVIYGGGSALACLEEAIAVGSGDMFAVVRTHPLHNLRVVLKGVQLMLEVPLEPPSMPTPAGPIVPHGGVAAYLPVAASGGGGVSWLRGLHAHVARLRDALAGTGLWADRPQLLAVLASRHAAALREDAQLEDGSAGPDEDAAARVLTRPLAPSQLEAAARAARHLPELWAALVQEAVPWVAAHASTSDMAVHRNLAV